MPEIQSAESLKELGNEAFKNGNNQKAIDCYTEALQLDPDQKLRVVLYRNRAMVKFKNDDFEGSEDDCTKGKEFVLIIFHINIYNFSLGTRWS